MVSTCDVTANTKGKGSEDGRFIGTNILNETIPWRDLLVTIEQPFIRFIKHRRKKDCSWVYEKVWCS